MIAELMKSLRRHALARYDRMHLIGHSLGAHVAGYAGERVPGTGRITGKFCHIVLLLGIQY